MRDQCDIDLTTDDEDDEVNRCPNEATQMFDRILGGYTFVCDDHASLFPARKYAGHIDWKAGS